MSTDDQGILPRSPVKSHIQCHDCALSRFCLPESLDEGEVSQLESIIKRNRPLQKHEHLFRAGEPMQHVYALRSGALKSYLLDKDGTEQITGFHLPGELIGLDGIGYEHYPSYAEALETSMVCAIPIHQLEELAGVIPSLRKQLLRVMSHEIQAEHEHLSHTRESAEQRLASFLLNLSSRYSKRGLSPVNFLLPMSRSEIGNYLGLTTETISRLFTRYREQNLIDSSGRELHILDPQALHRLGGLSA
ncbi:fumarate/nitrate reduction transcriptional regulator Fnr [Pseudomonas boanensis]|uniref:fumarate/nitrate reduction transcriptional regulator Fnr n=1 Tax=Metapseudomonas boanensis TaxID=2822138 RepID=UPI0035D51DDB